MSAGEHRDGAAAAGAGGATGDGATGAVADELVAPLRSAGGLAYLGEPITQLEHACQAAQRAVGGGASAELVTAALLHDVGWLLGGAGTGHGGDVEAFAGDNHAARGAAWLARVLPPAVADPVRLHVEAKRYLVATSPAYRARLSPASVDTLARQGGPHTPAEAAAFEAEPWAEAALALRRWDDEAKVPGLAVPGLAEWRRVVVEVARAAGRPADARG
ncbi:MAG TPA: hypothetical protein VFN60_06195 [Acidimicrobiales bacterium]|nr:hypothetical protein [Acidimicrobiales bacterium]